jgi:hypothetical protein
MEGHACEDRKLIKGFSRKILRGRCRRRREDHIVTCWVYVTRQITSRRIRYSEFIALALTFIQFTVSQLLPSAVSQLHLLLESLPFTRYNWLRRLLQFNWLVTLSVVTHSLVTGSMLTTHWSQSQSHIATDDQSVSKTHWTVFAAPYLGSARTT